MKILKTEVYRPVDWDIRLEDQPSKNPFKVLLKGCAEGPGRKTMEISGFYRGDNCWTVRFSPPVLGLWNLTTISTVPGLTGHEVQVQAVENTNSRVHGPLRVDPDHPQVFRYDDGSFCFLMGYELNWLWALDQTEGEATRLNTLLDNIQAAGFNHIFVNSYAYDTGWCEGKSRENDFGPPALIPWEGSPSEPDFNRLNPAYFEDYDRMIWALYERGLDAHIYLKVYNKKVEWPEKYSCGEDLFFDYFTARYQTFPNLVWDFSKECYYEPDKDYVAYRLNRLRSLDAYHHLTTVHDDLYFSYNKPYKNTIDFLTDQNHSEFYATILDQRSRDLGPIINEEYGYEHGPGGPDDKTYGVVQSPEEVLCRTCEVILAGGFPAYYYTNHAWDVIEWEEVPASFSAYRRLCDFFTSLEWWNMVPRPDLGSFCFTDEEDEIVLFSRSGRIKIIFPDEWDGSSWQGYGIDLLTGEKEKLELKAVEKGRRYRHQVDFKPVLVYLKKCDEG